MTTAVEICREEFTQAQLSKLLETASWQALFPIAIEMGFDIRKMAALNFNYIELQNLMKRSWREQSSRLQLCQSAYTKERKTNEKQRQVVMDFHLEGKDQ